MRSRSFTLIEAFVAIAIASLMLPLVFDLFHEFSLSHVKLKQENSEVLSEAHCVLRINNIFNNIVTDVVSRPIYYKNKKLCVIFCNAIDTDSAFRGPVKGVLYLKNNCFMLKTSSLNQKKRRKEILLSNVKRVKYSFLSDEWSHTGFCSIKHKKLSYLPNHVKIYINDEPFMAAFIFSRKLKVLKQSTAKSV